MQIKEKTKSKSKQNNNNKLPLPKIKYSNSKNTTSTRVKQINNQPLFNIALNNNNIDQYNMIHSNLHQSKEIKQKEDHKYNTKTNFKIKNIYDQKNNYKTFNVKNHGNTNYFSQNNLKYLLKEFGLSEYLRKLYELGYDNNNYLKIGTLSRKNFNVLLNNIHIFPGHTVKMEKFYEYLKKLNTNHNNTLYKKRKLNYNSIYGINNANNVAKQNLNLNQNKFIHYYNYNNYNSYNINKQSLNINNNNNNNNKNKKCLSPKNRPKTSHVNGFSKPKIRIRNNYSGNKIMKKRLEDYPRSPFINNSIENNKNSLIQSYLNDNHKFILNHKLNYNKNLLELQKKYNDIEFNTNKINFNYDVNEKQNMLYNSCNSNGIEKQRELEDKINENIERMLNYYMVQLNDKLDRSYETVEDSSLSYIITSQINESQNNLAKTDNKTVLPNYKLPSINISSSNNNNHNSNSINSNKKSDNNNNNNMSIAKLKNRINDNNKNKEKEKDKDNIINDINKDNEKEKEKEKHNNTINIEEKEKEIKNINNNFNIEKQEEALNKSKEEKKEITEEELKKETMKSKEDMSKEFKKFSDHETSTKSKDSKEQQPEEIEEDEFLLKDKKPAQFIKVENPINLKEKSDIMKDQPKLFDDSYLLNDKYSLEQNIYDTLRLNRSMDAENINKDSLKFDIEFMCRCLGLALMKHIEQGKEKQHITELFSDQNQNQIQNVEQNMNFTFFNTDFNNNISLLKDFFKNSNDSKLGDSNMISILEKFYIEIGEPDNDDIDLMKHIKKTGDEKIIQKDDIHEETFKLKTGLADIDNEIKFIGEFFSYGKKKLKNYQNLSENTKKILCKDLSYIKEIDSELNKTASVNNTDNANNSNYNFSKSNNNSKMNKIEDNSESNVSKADSKNNQENKTKIIGEEEKDEEYNNYEDEFINDDNLIENNINSNEEKEKEKEKDNTKKDEPNKNDNDNNKEKENKQKNQDILNINKDNLDDNNNKFENIEILEEIKDEKMEENKLLFNKKSDNINNTKEIGTTKLDIYPTSIKPMTNIEKNSFYNGILKQESENEIETDYIIDAENINIYKEYLIRQFEVFDDDFLYYSMNIPARRFMPPPDPQSIFEFCANIMILTKMEKEVIIISLIYIERLIFNTGFILNSRNWRKIIFISLIIASKLWDDDSLENIHYSQVFTHLKIGEINLLERTFLELINYKIFVKFSEYIKYYLAIKNMALKFNFNGEQIVPVSVEKMMKIQEYAYQMQRRMKRKISLNNSAHF